MEMRERFLNSLRGLDIDRMPAACPLQTGTLALMELSDSYWPEAHRDAKKMAILSMAAGTFAGMESARLPFDVGVDAEALGAKIGYADRVTAPFVVSSPFHSLDEIRRLDLPDIEKAGRVPLVDEAIGIVRRLRPDLPIVVTVHAPFTLSAQLRGEDMAMLDLAAQPERYRGFVDLVARWSSLAASHFVDSGADVVMMVDGEAGDSILGPELYRSFALPGQKKVVEAVRAGGAPSILHICGDISLSTEIMTHAGIDAISIGHGTSIAGTKEVVKDRCRIIGNLDPSGVLLKSTSKLVKADVRRCIIEGADIAAPGCDLSPTTPLENLLAMTDAIKKYGHAS